MRTNVRVLAFEKNSNPDDTRRAFARANPGAVVQTFSKKAAENAFLVQMIAAQTLGAMRTGSLLAKKPEIDFLLRLAGTSQISEAISRVGSKHGQPFHLVMANTGPSKSWELPLEGRRLPMRPLTRIELRKVEEAALLSARRA